MDIIITESITAETAHHVLQEMLLKRDNEEEPTDIFVYISSRGGELEPGYAICEMLKCSGRKVITCGIGEVYSCAVAIFLAGDERYATGRTKFMIHEVRHIHGDEASLTTKEYEKYLKELQDDTAKFFKLICENTKLTPARIKKYLQKAKDNDWHFDVNQAKKLGLVTKVGMPF